MILYSSKLVPGDLVRIRSDWLLPCDLLIIDGMNFLLHGQKYSQIAYNILKLDDSTTNCYCIFNPLLLLSIVECVL